MSSLSPLLMAPKCCKLYQHTVFWKAYLQEKAVEILFLDRLSPLLGKRFANFFSLSSFLFSKTFSHISKRSQLVTQCPLPRSHELTIIDFLSVVDCALVHFLFFAFLLCTIKNKLEKKRQQLCSCAASALVLCLTAASPLA